jgi:hypothetical protein
MFGDMLSIFILHVPKSKFFEWANSMDFEFFGAHHPKTKIERCLCKNNTPFSPNPQIKPLIYGLNK